MARNSAPVRLSLAKLEELPPGSQVIDPDCDIATKRPDGRWDGYPQGPITSARLSRYGRIRIWTGRRR